MVGATESGVGRAIKGNIRGYNAMAISEIAPYI